MKTGLTKKQKTTDIYFNAKDPLAEVYTHDTNLKKRLRKYAAKFPELCQQTDDDEQGGLRFEIDKFDLLTQLVGNLFSITEQFGAADYVQPHFIHAVWYRR